MLDEAEKWWLYTRKNVDMVTGTYFCATCQYMNDEEEECIFRKCPIFEADYRDAAEFEARVAARLTGLNAAELPCYPNFLCPYRAKHIGSCKACYLKHARLAVEAEMEKEGKWL